MTTANPSPEHSPEGSAPQATRAEILREIDRERDRQDAKWGGIPGMDRRDDHTYAAVLGEEFGEACQAWLKRDTHSLWKELAQVAAVAVAWMEELDNSNGMARDETGEHPPGCDCLICDPDPGPPDSEWKWAR